jgi:hypothetical protein
VTAAVTITSSTPVKGGRPQPDLLHRRAGRPEHPGLPKFLTFLLEREISGSSRPYDREFVVARDAEILAIADPALLPWN